MPAQAVHLQPISRHHNTYFFHADANPRFNEYITHQIKENKIGHSHIKWCTTSNAKHQPHCTLGYIYGKKNVDLSALNEKIKQQTSEVLKDCSHSLLTKVNGFRITPTGWVILTFKPKKKLHKLHDAFIEKMTEMKMMPSQFSQQNFLPHVSIGRLHPGADQKEALQELQQLFNAIQKNPFPFIIYNIGLDHSLNHQNNQILNYKLSRRDLGIIKVEHKGANNNIITLNSKEKAEKLAHKFFKYYGMESAVAAGQPKQVRQIKPGEYTIQIDDRLYKQAEGHFSNLTIKNSPPLPRAKQVDEGKPQRKPVNVLPPPALNKPIAAPQPLLPRVALDSPINKQEIPTKVQRVNPPDINKYPALPQVLENLKVDKAPLVQAKKGSTFFCFSWIERIFNAIKWFFLAFLKFFKC